MDPFREKILTPNAKREAMRELRERSGPIARGDLVHVVPSRGEALTGLCVGEFRHPLYGVCFDVLVAGRVVRFEAERVSRMAGSRGSTREQP